MEPQFLIEFLSILEQKAQFLSRWLASGTKRDRKGIHICVCQTFIDDDLPEVCLFSNVFILFSKKARVKGKEKVKNVVYYESIKRELKTKLIWVSVWWKTNNWSWRIYTTRIHCVIRQNKLETPKEKDEFNKREVHECDVRVHDPDVMVVPPTPKPTWKDETLTRAPSTIASSRDDRWGDSEELQFTYIYESLKWEIQTKPIYGFRCDERIKTKVEESTRLEWLCCVRNWNT